MSTPRRGVHRPRAERGVPAAGPAGPPKPPIPRDPVTAAPVAPAATTAERGGPGWLRLLDWVAWIALWISAVAAGYFLGRIDIAKALFTVVMLAITVLPWLRWVRPRSAVRLPPSRIAGLQGGLAILVALVLALSATYIWALAILVVELPLSLVVLIKTPRRAHA